MVRFLIDANLPYKLKIWNSSQYIHLNKIDDTWIDDKIWSYAIDKNLTIITKDSDFSLRIALAKSPPKVIHLRIGNMKFSELELFLDKVWADVLKLNQGYKLVNVYLNFIEAIN